MQYLHQRPTATQRRETRNLRRRESHKSLFISPGTGVREAELVCGKPGPEAIGLKVEIRNRAKLSPSHLLREVEVASVHIVHVGQHEPVAWERAVDHQGVFAMIRVESQVVRLVERFHAFREAAFSGVDHWVAARLEVHCDQFGAAPHGEVGPEGPDGALRVKWNIKVEELTVSVLTQLKDPASHDRLFPDIVGVMVAVVFATSRLVNT